VQLQVAFTAAGSVDDYDDDTKDAILDVLASAAGLGGDHGGKLTVTAASVRIEATFPLADADTASDAAEALEEAMGSTDAATALFADAGMSIEVESVPKASILDANDGAEQTIDDPAEAGLPLGLIAGAAGGALVVFLLVLVLYKRRMAARMRKRPLVAGSGIKSLLEEQDRVHELNPTITRSTHLPLPQDMLAGIPRGQVGTPKSSERIDNTESKRGAFLTLTPPAVPPRRRSSGSFDSVRA